MNNMKRTILALVLIASAAVAHAALPNPVTYFSFDSSDGSTVSDLSGSGRNLTLGSGAYVTNMSAVGRALWFDGTQEAWATFIPTLVTNRTVSFWYWRNSDPGPYFTENWNSGDSNSSMPMLITGLGTLNFRFNNAWQNDANPAYGLRDKKVIPFLGNGTQVYLPADKTSYAQTGFGRWVHYVLTVDVKSITPTGNGNSHLDVVDFALYVNGAKSREVIDGTIANGFSDSLATLGNLEASGKRPCCGAIDELKVFDVVLTEEQIREEFDRCAGPRLVAWYPMQEFSTPAGDGSFTTPDMTAYGQANGMVMTCSSETSVVPGPNGTDNALHFQGTDGTIATATVPFAADDFTISAWVNVSTNTALIRTGQSANYPPVVKYGNFYVNYVTVIKNTGMQYVMPLGGSAQNMANGIVGKGNWQHIVLVVRNLYDSIEASASDCKQRLEVYLNGEFSAAGNDSDARIKPVDATLMVGSRGVDTHRVFEGEVCDLRIYRGAMATNDVRLLFRGAAAVNAGTDTTVKGPSAVLCGSVAPKSDAEGVRTGYAGDVLWSLFSSPGGADVAFTRPHNPVTEVSLPVEGEYVFKLSTTGYLGATSEDTVTVVRDDANGTASVAPAVDVESVASNALVAASLSAGLVRYWNFNGIVRRELVGGNVMGATTIDWSKIWVTNGVTGCAVVNIGGKGCVFDTEATASEMAGTGGNNYPPANEWYSVSAWIRPRSGIPNDWYAGVFLSVPNTLLLCYGQWRTAAEAAGPIAGFSILQKGIAGNMTWLNFDLTSGMGMSDLEDGWHHVAALVNRLDTSKCEFFLDGVKLSRNESYKATGNYGGLQGDFSVYNGTPKGGRYNATGHVYLCNLANDSGNPNNIEGVVSNTTTSVVYSRRFPGVIDEVRCYTCKLSEVQIGYLAATPDPLSNNAPAVGEVKCDRKVFIKRKPGQVSALAADDGHPAGTLSYEWLVVSGDASAVSFSDASAAETTVTISEKGSYTLMLKVSDGERTTYGAPKTIDAQGPGMFLIVM